MPYLAAAATFRFVSRHNLGLFMINLCKKLPHIVKQEIGLFQSGEVSALWHFSFLYYVVCLSDPAKWRDSYLPRKIRVRHGSLQVGRQHHFLSSEAVLTIDSHCRAHRTGSPIERNIGQKCVAFYIRKKITIVVRKKLKFTYHPGQPPHRRVSQGIGKSLRFSCLKEKKAALWSIKERKPFPLRIAHLRDCLRIRWVRGNKIQVKPDHVCGR